MSDRMGKPVSQRQLRVGELVKQNLGELFIRNEAKIPSFSTKLITVTEVRMTPDLKTARAYVIPLGGVETKETVRILTEYSHLVRKALSKRLDIKFLPKLTFVEDNSFEYAEKIEKIIKENKYNDKEILVLAEGRLVNLAAATGHPASVMDMSFANQALATEWIKDNYKTLESKVYTLPKEVDLKIAATKLGLMGGELEILTEEQIKYLDSWEHGTS